MFENDNEIFTETSEIDGVTVDDVIDIAVTNETVTEHKVDQPKWRTKVCDVICRINKFKVVVDFEGYGLTVASDSDNNTIKIRYFGQIGTHDFKYEVK